ncbi:MAG: hypothetical protein A2W91_07650 [Bacteroidetes bacterium GWF2_38_335]|nr:MAG: hypothetical protein A2W91_07650 [Bacteroidetes bacterium GWF2_38_335]OFY79068.1 MAG: hypothetical protein A2281_03070 [Bacteroidetes bacterium RIFOXYA12_FULL_38_20]HBS86152.1 hypothetical protein [Bacteroidales bacterium]
MKKLFLIFAAASLAFFSCSDKEEKKEDSGKTDTLKTDTIVNDENDTDEAEWAKFEKVYNFEKDGHIQKLGVNWLSETEIEYRFTYSKGDCVLELTGKAGNINTDMGTEIDEDEDGAYPANEYVIETKEMELAFRIDAENKAKARVIQWVRDNKTCKIDDEVIMKEVK